MKRSRVGLTEIAAWPNLAAAFWRAASGAGRSPAVASFRFNLEANLELLQREIMDESLSVGNMTSFRIRDPKPRIIHAPCFRERVLHHALIAPVGPVLDRTLVDDSFACRKGKGGLAAVLRCQLHLRRFAWFVQIDIRSYFASVDHQVLLGLLERQFKNPGLLRFMAQIIDCYHAAHGKGLPIGALTSQHFANFYLSGLDRCLLEQTLARGLVRYMDDLIWFCDDKSQARKLLDQVNVYVTENLQLELKQPVRIGRSRDGTLFCGYRILPGALLLSRRRKRRYAERRSFWEAAYTQGRINAHELQAGYAAVFGMTAHASASAWRREQLRRKPLAKILEEV